MSNSVHYNKIKGIQKVGAILIIISGLITLLKVVDSNKDYLTQDLRNYIFLGGFFLYIIPRLSKVFKSKSSTTFLAMLFVSTTLLAQDYSKQIDAFTKSFSDKTTEAIQSYMSPKLQFGKIPVANTPAIMNNIVKNLPKLNSMTIIESEKGKAKVAYDFIGLGKSESHIHFDVEGRMTKIELVENLIKQEAEARRGMQNSVQLPTPGELGKKYIPTTIEFKGKDGLLINANLYEVDENKPIILLMHQAGYNRLEYADIAPRLNALGYNCLAVDLRSGGTFAGENNITHTHAKEKGLNPEMIDSQEDVKTAINFLYDKYNREVIVWGSSYSSSLALLEGVSNNKVKAIIAFSPGNYFGDAAPSLNTAFLKMDKPFFVTSSKEEAEALTLLMGNTSLNERQSQFIPNSKGFHGSRALWIGQKGAEEYWKSVTTFLELVKAE